MRLGVPIAIDVQAHDDSTRAGLAVGRADNAFVVSGDSTAKKLHAALAFASIDTTMPLKDFVSAFFNRSSTAVGTDSVKLSLPGVQGDFNYDGTADTLALRNLGLGDSTSRVTRGDATLLAIDVNAEAGRHVDVNITADAQKQLALDIAPKLQLESHVLDGERQPSGEEPRSLRARRYLSIQVDGPPALRLMEAAVGTSTLMRGGTGWLLGMTVGHLALMSRAMPAENVEVGTGKCLFRSTAPFTGQHEMLREVRPAIVPEAVPIVRSLTTRSRPPTMPPHAAADSAHHLCPPAFLRGGTRGSGDAGVLCRRKASDSTAASFRNRQRPSTSSSLRIRREARPRPRPLHTPGTARTVFPPRPSPSTPRHHFQAISPAASSRCWISARPVGEWSGPTERSCSSPGR